MSIHRPIRVSNPWLVSRRIFMGETPRNRLLDVRTDVILSRGALAIPDSVPYHPWPESLPHLTSDVLHGRVSKGEFLRSFFPAPPSTWSTTEREALEAAAKSPTQDEIRDAALVDSFFGFVVRPSRTSRADSMELLYLAICGGLSSGGIKNINLPPLAPNSGYDQAFLCTGVKPAFAMFRGIPLELVPVKPLFELDPSASWGDQALVVRNARVIIDTLETYPLPSPLSAGIYRWYYIVQGKLAEMARYKWPLDPQIARFLLTLIVLGTYEQASNEIMDMLEDKAKKAKRQAIINAIAFMVISLILPAVMAVGISAVTSVLDTVKAREAARDMVKAAQQFEATDAEFAGEIRRAAEIIDYQAAQEGAATSLTQEEEDAIREHGQEGEITPEEVEAAKGKKPPITELLVGGGVTAGLVALLLLR